ncbi:unnamed protein product [Schistocephalus solidus]|uniref:Transposase n=1 Tax=Schistocephalus solidus TaxID=70667 RepID=A0A183SMG1_SCHSO|nr:unnamed protein product [Schistocephalus solidus]
MQRSRILEHKQVVRLGDEVSQIAAHMYKPDHKLNFGADNIIAHAGKKTSRELIESPSADGNSSNRRIDLAPADRALRNHLQACVIAH